MSDNILLTPQTYTRGVLMNLGGYLSVCRNMSKEYSKEFGKAGAKVGDSISTKKPQRFQVTSGLPYQPQPLTNTKVTITADQVAGVHFEWDGVEKTLSIDDAQENYFKPAAIALAHDINGRAARFAAQNTFNAVGTPGSTPTLIDTYLSAGDKIVQLGLPPEEDLACIVNRKMSSQFVIGQKSLFNPAGSLGKAFDKGEVTGDPLGYKWHRDQTIYAQTTGPLGGAPLANGANQTQNDGNNGTGSLITDGWTAAAAARVVIGDRFTIANVYSVHPQTRQSTGDLQQFVITAAGASDGAGNLTLAFCPAITPTGQYQNVDSAAADNAPLTFFGAANTVSPQGLLLHKNAFAFVSVPLATPKSGEGVIKSSVQTDPDTGLSLALVQFFNGDSRTEGTRFDCLFGFAKLYPEMSCVIAA